MFGWRERRSLERRHSLDTSLITQAVSNSRDSRARGNLHPLVAGNLAVSAALIRHSRYAASLAGILPAHNEDDLMYWIVE